MSTPNRTGDLETEETTMQRTNAGFRDPCVLRNYVNVAFVQLRSHNVLGYVSMTDAYEPDMSDWHGEYHDL